MSLQGALHCQRERRGNPGPERRKHHNGILRAALRRPPKGFPFGEAVSIL